MPVVHRLMTRMLYPVVSTLTITRTTVKGHTYKRAYMKVPLDIAAQIAGDKRKAYVVALLGRASHLHAQYWDEEDILWRGLDYRLRKELEALGNTAWSPREVVLIPATREELERLGLDPSKPIMLEDVVEAVRRGLEQAAKPARPAGK